MVISGRFWHSLTGALVFLTCAGSLLAGESLPRYIEPSAETGQSAAVVVGDWPLVHTPQLLAVDEGGKVKSADAVGQMNEVLDALDKSLMEVQSDIQHVVKLNVYLAKQELAADVQGVLAKRFAGPHKPAVSLVVTPLPNAAALVAADAVATTKLDPGRAVKVGRDFSATVVPSGSRIYVAGQAEKGKSLAEATRATLESLRATLRFCGRSDGDVVQLKVFLTPMADVAVVHREIAMFYKDRPAPPTVFVEWKSGPETPIEIELVAWGGQNRTGEALEFLTPPGLPKSPIFSRVARLNHTHTIYVSGLYAAAGDPSKVDPKSPAAGEREVKEVFTTLQRVLKEAGGDLRHLAKATYYVATDSASAKLNELRPSYYDRERPPSASKAAVAGVGRVGLGLTIDMIAIPAYADASEEYGPPEQGHGLSPADAAAGWIALFDGKTTFGWKDAKVVDGLLSGGITTTEFGNCELRATLATGGEVFLGERKLKVPAGEWMLKETLPEGAAPAAIRLGDEVRLKQLALRPLQLESLLNGRDLTGWKAINHPRLPESKWPTWRVEDGALRGIGGPGCVEYRGAKYGNLVLQLDARTRLRHANGGGGIL